LALGVVTVNPDACLTNFVPTKLQEGNLMAGNKPIATAGLATAALALLRRRRRNTDPVHAPGHRHRKPPPNDRPPNEVDLDGKRDQPWIRRSHSDSQQRRFRR